MTLLEAALAALEAAGVRVSRRKPQQDETELDVWLEHADLRRADEALRRAGFYHLEAPGRGDHRFYVACRDGTWVKLDARLRGSRPARTPFSPIPRTLRRRRPVARRRLGPVVALLGPDGSGKGTVIRHLEARLPVGLTVVWFGSRPRAGGRAERGATEPPTVPRELAFVGWQFLRTWRRLLRAYAAAWRGDVVLCDRHPLERLAIRPERTRPGAALERFLFTKVVPRPDLLVVLEAPTDTLLARKHEHPAATLDRWRAAYREAFARRGHFVTTDDTVENTVARVAALVWEALRARRRW